MTAAAAGFIFLASCTEEAPAAFSSQTGGMRTDSAEFTLEPFESVEYKYRLGEGAQMSFSWAASSPVYYDMHSDPANTGHAAPGEAPSFETGTSAAQEGGFVAPFDGIHGWFWENRSAGNVTVRVASAGFYSEALVINRMGETSREPPLALP